MLAEKRFFEPADPYRSDELNSAAAAADAAEGGGFEVGD